MRRMNPNRYLIEAVQQANGLVGMHLADMTDADLLVRPCPTANHGIWQLQQVAGFDVAVANALAPGSVPPLPDQYQSTKDTAGIDDPAKFMKKDEVMSVLKSAADAITTALGKMSTEDLDAASPEHFRSYAPTLGSLAALAPMHAAMHLGQIQVIRRTLGKPRIF